VVAGSADDHVCVAVSIDIARAGDVPAQNCRCLFRRHRDQHAPVFAGIDVSLACSGRAGYDVRNAITIDIAGGLDAEPSWSPGFPSTLQISLPVLVEYT